MKILKLVLPLIALLCFSCNNDDDINPGNSKDCILPNDILLNVSPVDSSIAMCRYNKFNEEIFNYIDSDGMQHALTMRKAEVQIEQPNTWECDDNADVLDYSVTQNTTRFTLEGDNLPKLSLTVQVQIEEDRTTIAYDYLSIGRFDNDGTVKEDFELLLNERATNSHEDSNMESIESIELNGTVFTDLYRNIEGEHIYYYKKKYGLIGFSFNDQLYTIEPCEFPGFPDPAEIYIQPGSAAQTGYTNQSGNISFTNLGGEEVSYQIENTEETYYCFHSWVCPGNPLINDFYGCQRPFVKTDLLAADGTNAFCISASLRYNTNDPFAYADVLNIGFHESDDVLWTLSFVLDPRTDDTANNDGLDFYNSITLNGIDFESVYVNQITDDNPYKIYYKLGVGMVAYENTDSDELFVLN